MPWLQIHIATDSDNAEFISELLSAADALAVTFRDAGDEPLLQQSQEAKGLWSQTQVTGLFNNDADAQTIINKVEAGLGKRPVWHAETLADEDWTRSWMERFTPMHFGGDLWVVPSWHQAPHTDAANIFLDPGLAFGTGTHASTALCLSWLAEQNLTGKTVIDYGCGSGILAIAALKLGAKEAWGVDNDPLALPVAMENAEKNGVSDHLHTALPEDFPANRQADLVLANILAEPLQQLASMITGHVKPGGQLVLAGLLAEQTEAVAACYPDFSFNKVERDGWARLDGDKSASKKS